MNKLIKSNSMVNNEIYIIDYIKELVKKSNRIDIIVSFVKKSGVKSIEDDLRMIVDKGIPLRILTSTYMNITEPTALYMIKEIIGSHGEVRLFDDHSISFHPKAYFLYTDDDDYVLIGSSNLSKMALSRGVEWNYRLSRSADPNGYMRFQDEFERLYHDKSIVLDDLVLKKYSNEWINPMNRFHDSVAEVTSAYHVSKLFEPNDAQTEALYELKRIRQEGADKAIVVAATGTGKTYLAAFDSRPFKKILFIAHREEILKQAKRTFESLGFSSLGLLNGVNRSYDSDVVFASIQTITRDEHLHRYNQDHFDYIVVDECHHSAAGSYRKAIEYFKPEFMLGLTATPYRMDNQDIFALMDYNLAYEADLFSSINKGWLVPFYYYGIYDQTVNYENITYLSGKYSQTELEENLSINRRADLVLTHFRKYKRTRAIGFCSSIKHADFMAKAFSEKGFRAVAVHSRSDNRVEAIEMLKSTDLDVIFTVDMFNEGLDIKQIDMVMFLRPTESATVFLQQLGRGLRIDEGKTHLTVLDFIGNYKKVSLIPFLLSGKSRKDYLEHRISIQRVREESFYPQGCRIEFDFQVIELLEKYNRERTQLKDIITDEFDRIHEELERIPTRVELFTNMKDDIYQLMKRNTKLNILKDFLRYMSKFDPGMKETLDTFAHEFINMVEKTSMTKLYKIPILLAFYNHGDIRLRITSNDISKSFRDFYETGQNGLDMLRDKSTKNYRLWSDSQYYSLAKRNPMNFLQKTHGEFFSIENDDFVLNDRLRPYIKELWFIEQYKDAVELRRIEFMKNRLI